MTATTSTDWVSYYRANCGDRETIEALYALAHDELMDRAKGQNNDSGMLRTTITSSGAGANLMLVPDGPKGIVKFLHHGFLTTTHLGRRAMILYFIQGNFSSSPFNAISRLTKVVLLIDQGRPMTLGNENTAPTVCPTLAAMYWDTSKDRFAARRAGGQPS